jgi:hypothetical protein
MAIPNRFAALALVLLLTAPAVIPAQTESPDAVPSYVDLIDQTEKWFTSDFPGKSMDLRLHTRVNGTFNGAVIEEREILLGRDVIERHRLLYQRDATGDVYYYGDLEGRVLDEPILWVDAPLSLGKTWTASIPAFDNGIDPREKIHYVFACLETEDVNCPMGVIPAYRVFVATIQPDGQTTNCNFWYNAQCGLVRCCLENQRVYLLHKTISPAAEDPDLEIDIPLPAMNTLGSYGSPNPANPSTDVRFQLPGDVPVSVDVYDISGRLVRTLADAMLMNAGECSLNWNGCDNAGRTLASGVYVYRIQAAGLTESGRLTLVR